MPERQRVDYVQAMCLCNLDQLVSRLGLCTSGLGTKSHSCTNLGGCPFTSSKERQCQASILLAQDQGRYQWAGCARGSTDSPHPPMHLGGVEVLCWLLSVRVGFGGSPCAVNADVVSSSGSECPKLCSESASETASM